MTDTKTTGERLAGQASEWALALGEVSDGPIITSLYGTDISKQIKDVKDILNRCSEALSTQDQQDTAMAWTLAEIRQIIGVDEKPMLSELPDLVRAAVKREWLPIDDYAKSGVKIIAADITGPAKHHEIGCLSWNVEGEYWQDHGFQYIVVKPEPTHYMPLPAPPQTEGEGK